MTISNDALGVSTGPAAPAGGATRAAHEYEPKAAVAANTRSGNAAARRRLVTSGGIVPPFATHQPRLSTAPVDARRGRGIIAPLAMRFPDGLRSSLRAHSRWLVAATTVAVAASLSALP
ncbi:MAG TPA: hypothetical protein VN923_11225, partial [Thermoanaerobaculia bacterium]|nr:hypothetical protein [Thermoanaerobaculia bacterium]